MTRIAVIADTHDRLPPGFPGRLQWADEIWHLGDVTAAATLEPLYALGKPLRLVRGNCDTDPSWPLFLDLEREGFSIRLVHIPPREGPVGIDLLFHGHTHVPRNERVGNARFFNPGTIGKPNKGVPPSYAWLELSAGSPPGWELVPL